MIVFIAEEKYARLKQNGNEPVNQVPTSTIKHRHLILMEIIALLMLFLPREPITDRKSVPSVRCGQG